VIQRNRPHIYSELEGGVFGAIISDLDKTWEAIDDLRKILLGLVDMKIVEVDYKQGKRKTKDKEAL
jgi:hypothetical protein